NDMNAASHKVLSMMYYILDTEAAMLEMNRLSRIDGLTDTFAKYSLNIGSYSKFFLFAYTDEQGRYSYETEMDVPTGTVFPCVWIDKTGTSVRPEGCITTDQFIPVDTSEEPCCYYISHIHFGDHAFGYSAIMMDSDEPINEFYSVWMVNISISLETFLQRSRVKRLVEDLEEQSTHDRLTGMLNRRGFEKESDMIYSRISEDPESVLSVIMVDMDKLKYINDAFGHKEGDFAISTLGSVILSCCGEGDISGRTGGDEFYIVLPGKDEEDAERTVELLNTKLDEVNRTSGKEYTIDVSCGIYSAKIKQQDGLEDFLRESDERMYEKKLSKNAQRMD
ncbi:MAG: GGDEF domain-containing protein, partial [Oscillospiraceae bacterium]|nr:GGDEF domain-containing protein [Oscillospiraceae bacterium]